MRKSNRIKMTPAFVLLVLSAGAMMTIGSVFPQATQVNGTVKLKQADGTVVPAGQTLADVQINGASAISGATVFSDSTVTTAKGSSAVVSLGKLGRVEVLPESSMKLNFGDSSISVSMLESGRVRVSSSSGVSAAATTMTPRSRRRTHRMSSLLTPNVATLSFR
jgi:hypothetical protein